MAEGHPGDGEGRTIVDLAGLWACARGTVQYRLAKLTRLEPVRVEERAHKTSKAYHYWSVPAEPVQTFGRSSTTIEGKVPRWQGANPCASTVSRCSDPSERRAGAPTSGPR